MRLALADIKKVISRRGGVTRLTPYLLRPGELAREVEALIALYEAWVGRKRSDFPSERAAELIGDYRLARCLTNCLTENYEWQAPQWPGSASDDAATALAERGIASPTHLRLALYDWVNDHAGGYLSAANRESALDACAASLGLRRATFDTLLALDGDAQAVLRRLSDTPPTAGELAQRYNQRAFEALLANAASVEWQVPADIGQAVGEPLGTVVKRLCFLARTMGVHYDLSFADTEALPVMPDAPPLARVAEAGVPYETGETGAADDATETLEAAERPIRVLLYGPQEISVAPAAYGERLARLCRALLGYRRGPERSTRRATLAGSGLQGVAQVYLHGRPLPFVLDEKLLKLLGVAADGAAANAGAAESRASYDSALEARFASEFAALERADAAHGWRLEREPEPLLVGETILVPDFALTRGMRRVYLEIAGYWRPGYRERKARKLTALRGRVTLAIAAPEAARGELGIFEGVFPLLWYTRDHIRAHELIALLDRAYDDSTRRLATLDPPRIAAEVALRGRIPPRESYALLHSYTRAELDTALHALAGEDAEAAPVWVDGLGLCDPAWLADLLARVRAAVVGAPEGRMPLTQLASHLREHEPTLAELDEATVESLAARAGLAVVRTSIFAADIVAPEVASAIRANAESMASDNESQPQQPSRPTAQPRPRARRKQHRQNGQNGQNGQNEQGSELAQLNFFSPERADDEGTHED